MANNVPEFLGAKSCVERGSNCPNQRAGEAYGQLLRAIACKDANMVPRSNTVSAHRAGYVATAVGEIPVGKAVARKSDRLSVGIPLCSAEQEPSQNGFGERFQSQSTPLSRSVSAAIICRLKAAIPQSLTRDGPKINFRKV